MRSVFRHSKLIHMEHFKNGSVIYKSEMYKEHCQLSVHQNSVDILDVHWVIIDYI